MGLPRPDAGTPVHDYLASRQSRLVILEWPWVGPEAQSDKRGFDRACEAALKRLGELEEG